MQKGNSADVEKWFEKYQEEKRDFLLSGNTLMKA